MRLFFSRMRKKLQNILLISLDLATKTLRHFGEQSVYLRLRRGAESGELPLSFIASLLKIYLITAEINDMMNYW